MIVRVRVGSETLIVGPRAEFAALAAVHAAQASALASEYEVRRRLLIALADPALAGELRRAFGRWREEGPRLGEADDRALIDRVAQMTRNGMLAAFVVSDRSKHHGRAAAAAAEGTPKPASAATAVRVEEMDLQARIEATLRLVPNHLSGATREEFLKLIEPEAIALTSGVLAVWAVSHLFGIGEMVDVLLIAAGIVLAGPQFWLGVKKLRHALELVQTATSPRELDEAAQAFADMIATLGVAVLVAAITHGAGKRAARWKEKKASLRNKPAEKAPKAERLEERPKSRPLGGDESTSATPKKEPGEAKPRRSASARDHELAKTPGATAEIFAARKAVVEDFYVRHGMENKLPDELKGIDLSKPVEVVRFPPPDMMTQYVRDGGRPGRFFDPVGGQTPDALGISGEGRSLVTFKTPEGEGLKTTSAPIVDAWTNPENPIETAGGGTQIAVDGETARKFEPWP